MLSHISRSVALSMLGYSCLAHSYWQRCHKTGLWGAISGEEETVVELTRRRPYACPVDSFPQALCAHPWLHCIIYSFAQACRTSDFFELSVSLSPEEDVVWLYEEAAGGVRDWRSTIGSCQCVIIRDILFLSLDRTSNILFYLSLVQKERNRFPVMAIMLFVFNMFKLLVDWNIFC